MVESNESILKLGVEKLKDPTNIREAVYASSPSGLQQIFDIDVTVQRLITAGLQVVPFIANELETNGMHLHEITLACFAYILHKVDPESAVNFLEPLFIQAMEKPGPFFVNFAAYPIRKGVNLPQKKIGSTHSKADLLDTLEAIKKKSSRGT